ncbi:hypothetical protein Glove_228g102 [Diversispora epigaea]|nr:hypothetical protein Glove_228g102 [Diversispora epigaea]
MNLIQLVEKDSVDKKIELFPENELDLDGSWCVSINDEGGSDLRETEFNIDEITQIIPLKEGIQAHRNKEYQKAWDCFAAHADLDNAHAKYWKGYYLWEGIEVKKDREQAFGLFKEAADDGIGDAQLYYAFSLVSNPLVKFDRKIFLEYLTKSAHNNNPIAQFSLGEIYLRGEHGIGKDEELGMKYLRLAALNDQPKAKEILQKLRIEN